MPMPYVLAARLAGHTADVRWLPLIQVRALAAFTLKNGTTLLLSGSRDGTARVWVPSQGGYTPTVLDTGSGFVNAVSFFDDGEAGTYTH